MFSPKRRRGFPRWGQIARLDFIARTSYSETSYTTFHAQPTRLLLQADIYTENWRNVHFWRERASTALHTYLIEGLARLVFRSLGLPTKIKIQFEGIEKRCVSSFWHDATTHLADNLSPLWIITLFKRLVKMQIDRRLLWHGPPHICIVGPSHLLVYHVWVSIIVVYKRQPNNSDRMQPENLD